MTSLLTASVLRNAAIFAGMLCILLGGTWAVVNATTRHLLYENATSTARSWAQYLASNATDLEQIAGGERPSIGSMAFFQHSQKSDQVFRYEIYDRHGYSLLVSDHNKVALADISEFSPDAARAAKTGQAVVGTREGIEPDQPSFFAQAFVPVVANDRVIAVVAAYVDQTEQRNSFNATFLKAAAALCLLTGLSFVVPTIVFIGRDMTERLNLERQLRQAQKMEAIGQLTGGIAHDFNNILAVIIGMTELTAVGVAGDAKLSGMVKQIDEAAERGAQLVQRMLAFARKQPLEARVLDVNDAVKRAAAMLERAVGEDITLQTSLSEDIWPALVDPSQLEDAIVNLSVNARDAMSKGGDLVLETANVHLDEAYAAGHADVSPGDYVAVMVTDSGTGMPPEVIERAFEPFFTTKAAGRGTGLGLSMVYGFVKQSRGHVKISSEVGHGTSIKMYFPKAERKVDTSRPAVQEPERTLPSGRETILVVEDDTAVRKMAVTTLEGLGYQIHQAPDGKSALDILHGGDHIDLLFTDMIMPNGVSGQDLVEAARQLRPNMKALLTSGYSEQFVTMRGNGNGDVRLLSKPYRREKLATMVRNILDGDGRV